MSRVLIAVNSAWNVANFRAGLVRALVADGHEVIAAVVDDGALARVEALGAREPELRATIEKFRAEEVEHHDAAIAHGSEQAFGHTVLTTAIKQGCKIAIALSTRL